MEKQLPKNWVSVSLKEVTKNVKGKKPNIQSEVEFEGSIPYMDIKALEHNIIRQYADIESSKLFDEGDIAMVWDGARSGWVSKTNFGAIGSTLVAFKPVRVLISTNTDEFNYNEKLKVFDTEKSVYDLFCLITSSMYFRIIRFYI